MTFLAALVAFGLLATSIPTEYMVEANVMDSSGKIVGFIHFGILRGTKTLNDETDNFIGEYSKMQVTLSNDYLFYLHFALFPD